MSRNIKEIGKELLGKSLNSFHRKTGLTQLEKNNEMQDGILDGMLSQVDDAYIEKTEQSNVIHLDGSGDGVVVLDSIEGNTMVNYIYMEKYHQKDSSITVEKNKIMMGTNADAMAKKIDFDVPVKDNSNYTIIFTLENSDSNNGIRIGLCNNKGSTWTSASNDIFGNGVYILKINSNSNSKYLRIHTRGAGNNIVTQSVNVCNLFFIEGHDIVTEKEIPSYFEGLQSSFKEQVEEDKYKIEILMNNKNLLDSGKYIISQTNGSIGAISNNILTLGHVASSGMYCEYQSEFIKVKEETAYSFSSYITEKNGANANHIMRYYDSNKNQIGYSDGINNGVGSYTRRFTTTKGTKYIKFCIGSHTPTLDDTLKSCKVDLSRVMLKIGDIDTNVVPYKSNKIKLLLDEPLRAIGDYKDRLLYKDNKLVIQRNVGIKKGNKSLCTNQNNHSFSIVLSDGVAKSVWNRIENRAFVKINNVIIPEYSTFPEVSNQETLVGFYQNHTENANLSISNGAIKPLSDDAIIEVIYQLKEPYYEEVLNEYGEPILLEGYENGTIYIDSTIVPTTTVRYTPKMESFKTLKEVNNDNIMLTNDINDNIIPYLMDVDLMIMEKEMALPSKANIRTMEVLDMTSMQKRTQDMLERLIKGKTLTEQECKTRVTTYLNAGKITDAQAKELNFLIDEIYA